MNVLRRVIFVVIVYFSLTCCQHEIYNRYFLINRVVFHSDLSCLAADIVSDTPTPITPQRFLYNISFSLQNGKLKEAMSRICIPTGLKSSSGYWSLPDCMQCFHREIVQTLLDSSQALLNSLTIKDDTEPTDASIIYAHAAYSSSVILDGDITTEYCLVGSFSYRSIIAILLMVPNGRVSYIVGPDFYSSSAFAGFKTLQTIFSNLTFHEFKTRRNCTTLHIRGALVPKIRVLLELLSRFPPTVEHLFVERYSELSDSFGAVASFLFEDYLAPVDNQRNSAPLIRFDSVALWYGGTVSSLSRLSRGLKNERSCYSPTNYKINKGQLLEFFAGKVSYNAMPALKKPMCSSEGYERPIFITFRGAIFIETAEGICTMLKALGYSHVQVMGEFDRSDYLEMVSKGQCPLQVAIGAHQMGFLSKRFILFHTENEWSELVHLAHYKEILRGARAVLVYSQSHAAFVAAALGTPTDNIYLIPMYSAPLYRPSSPLCQSRSSLPFSAPSSFINPANDILFLVSTSTRRELALNLFRTRAAADNLSFIYADADLFERFRVDTTDPGTREFLAGHSKVSINVHQQESSVLEVHRINSLLSMGVCVVSEYSSMDPLLDSEYSGTVLFGETWDDMYDIARDLILFSPSRRRDCYLRSMRKYSEIMNTYANLSAAIVRGFTN